MELDVNEVKYNRVKGNSIIEYPDNFTVIDIETTGLDPKYDNIIELAGIKYRKGEEVARFQELVQPPKCFYVEEVEDKYKWVEQYVNSYITELTGITNEMLGNARTIEKVLPEYLDFIGDDIVIGHNVNFDINFICDNAFFFLEERLFTNDFVDTLRIARKLLKDLKHHRMKDLAELYHVDYEHSHRALGDCEITHKVLNHLYNDIIEKYSSFDEFKKLFKSYSKHRFTLKASDIIADNPDMRDEENPLFGKVCVFTGTLKMPRKDAMQIVSNIGGLNADSITKKTNYLIIGSLEYSPTVKEGKSTKMKKAEDLKLKGQDIEVISENVFYDIIGVKI